MPTAVNWPKLRDAWESRAPIPGSIRSLSSFANEHNVARETLTRKIADDAKCGQPWPKPAKIVAQETPAPAGLADRNVVDLAALQAQQRSEAQQRAAAGDQPDTSGTLPPGQNGNGKGGSKTGRSPTAGTDDDDVRDLTIDQVLTIALEGVKRTAKRYRRGKATAAEVQMGRSLVGTLKDIITVDRTRRGLKNGDPDEEYAPEQPATPTGDGEVTGPRTITVAHRKIEPVRVPVDESGRMIDQDVAS